MSEPHIGIVAGEPSGDLIASRLMQSIVGRFTGIGGQHMQAQGLQSMYDMNALSVFGYVDALRRLPQILRIFYGAKRQFLKQELDVFVGIDAPDFNLPLEQRLRQQGIPTVHYVSPSIWAWRYERIHKIRKAVSHMLVLFPFEVPIYEKEGIPVTFVGHPLASQIPSVVRPNLSRERLGIPTDAKVLAILPGSRKSEIDLLAPQFLATAQTLQAQYPEMHFMVPLVNPARAAQFKQIAQAYSLKHLYLFEQAVSEMPISWDVMQACDAALLASGTACLETALFQKPMVIAYILTPLMKRIMQYKAGKDRPNIPWIGLPNILLQSFVVPELLQEAVCPEVLTPACEKALFDTAYIQRTQSTFQGLHQMLAVDTAKLASDVILKLAQKA